MFLPVTQADRLAVYRNLIRQCDVSREDRRARNRDNKLWYLTGRNDGTRSPYNAIGEFVEQSASHIYAQESTKFGAALPKFYGDEWLEELEAARDHFSDLWSEGPAATFGLGVEWAHVWQSTIYKLHLRQNRPSLSLLSDPADFGVLRESVALVDQEAVCHWHVMSLDDVERLVQYHPPRERARIMYEAAQHAEPWQGTSSGNTLPPALGNILMSSVSPTMTGVIDKPAEWPLSQPREMEPVVRFAELWVRDDAAKDWRVATVMLPQEHLIWEPLNPTVPGELPFHALSLMPVPGLVWGQSIVERLIKLQAKREDWDDWIDLILHLQADPPRASVGVSGVYEERMSKLRSPGGTLALPQGADIKNLAPPMPPDAIEWTRALDSRFGRVAGLPKAMTGEMDANVRGGEQAMAIALLGSGATMRRAMYVEHAINAVASQFMRLEAKVQGRPLKLPTGSLAQDGRTEFLLSQMPAGLAIKVVAHSHSPVYRTQMLTRAMVAAQHKAIDGPDLVELLDLPMSDQARAKARRMALAGAAHQDRVLDLKEQEAAAKTANAQVRLEKTRMGQPTS